MKTMDLSKVANRMVNTYSGGMIRKLEIASRDNGGAEDTFP